MKDKKLLKKKIEEKPMIDLLQSTRTPNCLNDSNIRKSTRPNWLLERRKKKQHQQSKEEEANPRLQNTGIGFSIILFKLKAWEGTG